MEGQKEKGESGGDPHQLTLTTSLLLQDQTPQSGVYTSAVTHVSLCFLLFPCASRDFSRREEHTRAS